MTSDAGALSKHADSVSAPSSTRRKSSDRSSAQKVTSSIEARNKYADRRRARYDLRAGIREHTKTKRLRACGYWPTSTEGVDLHCREDENVAYYAGLQACGSPWICPVCAAKIRQKHAEHISAAALQWLQEGRALSSMMLTVPHDRGMRLGDLWDFVRGAFRKLLTGRYWKDVKRRFGLEGFVRSSEVTHGANGWHPHIHILIFFRSELTSDDLGDLADLIYDRWNGFLLESGFRSGRRSLFALEPVRSASSISAYLAKVSSHSNIDDYAAIDRSNCTSDDHFDSISGICSYRKYTRERKGGASVIGHPQKAPRVGLEMARGDLKSGRSGGRAPFQIIRDFLANPVVHAADLALWLEWEDESKGKRSIEWSRDTIYRDDGSYTFRSFKARFGLEDESDEELATEEVGGERVRSISTWEWTALRATDRVGRLLEVAESHGKGGVEYYLEWLTGDFLQTGDLTALDELDELIERSHLVPKLAGG